MFIVEQKPKSMIAEAYRTLRTNIQYSSFDNEIKTIAVTSTDPGEGKSTVVGNLAFAISQGEKRVLIIDCDLRKPSLHKRFRISNLIGLSDILIGSEELDNGIYKHSEHLHIITSGKVPPNPSEMLGSKSMTNLLEELKNIYDYIILDTAPVRLVADAQILSTKVDGTILVVKAGASKKDEVMESKKLLEKVNSRILGTVLNGVENSKNKYYNYYGYGHDGESKKRKKKN
ncbi:MAG: CpsD/CapB family tyrosine-protein kinase [Clostridium sp.]